jgi:hypothetical protein
MLYISRLTRLPAWLKIVSTDMADLGDPGGLSLPALDGRPDAEPGLEAK